MPKTKILRVLKHLAEDTEASASGTVIAHLAGLHTLILEPRKTVTLQDPFASDESATALPSCFDTGPVFVTRVTGGYVEAETGLSFTSGRALIRESAMKSTIAESAADRAGDLAFDKAEVIRPVDVPTFVISNQRAANYCRWWLDCMSKYYLFEVAKPLHNMEEASMTYIGPRLEKNFQSSALNALGLTDLTITPRSEILHGDFYITSGITFKGGQNISSMITGFRAFCLERLSKRRQYETDSMPRPRIYISRRRSPMRRILNEEDLLKVLSRHGFVDVCLEDFDVFDQIMLFSQAEMIVSPHGAGLTNVLFCRPGTKLLEIFPDVGLHSSAFMRMATLLELPYGYQCGSSVSNRLSAKNSANYDIVVDLDKMQLALDRLCN